MIDEIINRNQQVQITFNTHQLIVIRDFVAKPNDDKCKHALYSMFKQFDLFNVTIEVWYGREA